RERAASGNAWRRSSASDGFFFSTCGSAMSEASSAAGIDNACPDRPETLEAARLKFIRRGMVSWSDPMQLMQTGMKTLISTLFGSYADKRELLSVLDDGENPVHEEHRKETDANGEFWFDFVADS